VQSYINFRNPPNFSLIIFQKHTILTLKRFNNYTEKVTHKAL